MIELNKNSVKKLHLKCLTGYNIESDIYNYFVLANIIVNIILCKHKSFFWIRNISQAFIQALLSIAVFPQRFSFSFCLLSLVAPWDGPMVDTEEKIWNLGLKIAEKCILPQIFLKFLEFFGEFWRNVDQKDTCNFPSCLHLSI